MNITYKNFKLVKDQERYDLYMTKTVISKDKETGKEVSKKVESLIGYSFSFPSAIQRIIEILSDTGEETITLKEYVKNYREIQEKITSKLLNIKNSGKAE